LSCSMRLYSRGISSALLAFLALPALAAFPLPGLAASGGAPHGPEIAESHRLPKNPAGNPVRVTRHRPRKMTADGATATTLTLSAATVDAGTAVTLTAQVLSGLTEVAPGILQFCDAAAPDCAGSGLLATAVLDAHGKAVRTLMLPAGSYSIDARFQGTAPYAASRSALQSLTVQGSSNYVAKATLTGVTGSNGMYSLGASLASHGPASPTGSLVFTDTTDNLTLGSVPLATTALGGYQPFGLISTGAASGPNDLAVGDFNGDGIPDLVTPDSATGVVAVFQGNGDGTFAAAADDSTGPGSQPLAVAVGDFNGDGVPDLAVALGNQAEVAILLGNGDGTFQPPRMAQTAGSQLYYPLALTVGDLNGDGRLDIATANNSIGVSVLLGNGDGTFQPYKLLGSSQGPTWITSGDFNGDGILDLAVTTSTGTVDISLGNGDGSFQTFTPIATGNGSNPESAVAADLDGDGNLDLVVAGYGANGMGVLLGNGDGTFLPIEYYATGAGPISVTVADLNVDGIPDVVTTNLNANSLSLFDGNGDGTFLPLPAISTTSGSEPAASVVADLNADGAPEIASVLYGSSALYVLQTGRAQGVVLKNVPLSTVGTIDLTASYAGDSLYAPAASAAYAFTASATTAVAPAFSPAAGSYMTPQTVTLASTTPGAQLYYTVDGSTPTVSSNFYASAIPVNTSLTISAIAIATGFSNSSVAKAAYVIETPAATPVFSPPAGTYSDTQNVTLTSTTAGATIYYTVNGAAPTTASAQYAGPIAVSASITIEAIATAPNFLDSAVVTAAYTIIKPAKRLRAARPRMADGRDGHRWGASEQVRLVEIAQGLNRVRKKGNQPARSSNWHSAGARARVSRQLSAARLKPCPCYPPRRAGIFQQPVKPESARESLNKWLLSHLHSLKG
jgi:hypothetical protein